MACPRKRFAKTKICIGDLRNQIIIQERAQVASEFEDDDTPIESFTDIATVFAGIKTSSTQSIGAALFSGVNLNDRATHTFTIMYDPTLANIEAGNNFILFDSRRFRILSRAINDENNLYIDISCSERGLTENESSEV